MQTPNKKNKNQDLTEVKQKRRILPTGFYDSNKPLIRSDNKPTIPRPNRTQTSGDKFRKTKPEQETPNQLIKSISENKFFQPYIQQPEIRKQNQQQNYQVNQLNDKGQIIIQIIFQQQENPNLQNTSKKSREEDKLTIVRYAQDEFENKQAMKYKVIVSQSQETPQRQIDIEKDQIIVYSPPKCLDFSEQKNDTVKKAPFKLINEREKSPIFEPRYPYPQLNQSLVKNQSNKQSNILSEVNNYTTQSPPGYRSQQLAPYFSDQKQSKNNEFSLRNDFFNSPQATFNTCSDPKHSRHDSLLVREPNQPFLSNTQHNGLYASISQPWFGPKQYKYDKTIKELPTNLNGDNDKSYLMPDDIHKVQNYKQSSTDNLKRNIFSADNGSKLQIPDYICVSNKFEPQERISQPRTSERKKIFSPKNSPQKQKQFESPQIQTPPQMTQYNQTPSPQQEQVQRIKSPIFEPKTKPFQPILQTFNLEKRETLKKLLNNQQEKKNERQKWYKGGQMIS